MIFRGGTDGMATGQLDDTVILAVADHGDLLGDHWLDGKGPWHYDGCTRVPLLLRYPRTIPAGGVVDGFASQCDLAPTLCDLLGVPTTTWPPGDASYAGGRLTATGVLPDVQGVSLVPAAQGSAPAERGARRPALLGADVEVVQVPHTPAGPTASCTTCAPTPTSSSTAGTTRRCAPPGWS